MIVIAISLDTTAMSLRCDGNVLYKCSARQDRPIDYDTNVILVQCNMDHVCSTYRSDLCQDKSLILLGIYRFTGHPGWLTMADPGGRASSLTHLAKNSMYPKILLLLE